MEYGKSRGRVLFTVPAAGADESSTVVPALLWKTTLTPQSRQPVSSS